MPNTEKIVEIFSELRNFADNDVHPVVSPENWHIYSKLHDLIDQAEVNALAMLKEQEVKTGHWIDTTNTIGFPRCKCSECNSEAGAIWMKYCPNCGAKMKSR